MCYNSISLIVFENKYDWRYMPMHMIFDENQQDLQLEAKLVVGGNVVDSTEHTKYSSTIKDVSVRLMILISAKNGL